MQKWEYTTIIIEKTIFLEIELNAMGKNGWELVQVIPFKGLEEQLYIFKRPHS